MTTAIPNSLSIHTPRVWRRKRSAARPAASGGLSCPTACRLREHVCELPKPYGTFSFHIPS